MDIIASSVNNIYSKLVNNPSSKECTQHHAIVQASQHEESWVSSLFSRPISTLISCAILLFSLSTSVDGTNGSPLIALRIADIQLFLRAAEEAEMYNSLLLSPLIDLPVTQNRL